MVRWIDGAIADPRPASDAAVKQAEDHFRVNFPADFLAVAKVHQGAAPVPAKIDLPNGFGTAVANLFHFEDDPFMSNIIAAYFPVRASLEKGVFPFAVDVGGDLFCFSFREDYDNPPVIFWSVDWGTLPLAPTFDAFVALLHD